MMENKMAIDIDVRSTEEISDRIWHGAPRENLVTRVTNAIRAQIKSGQLSRGVQLRGEIEFARELGVSRQTLREATRVLTQEGLLTIRHGVGTFVAESAKFLSSALDTMTSMSALIQEKGGEARIEGLKVRRIAATAEIALALDIAAHSPVAEITRLRLVGSRPLALAFDYISLDTELKLPIIRTFDGASIYQFMATKLQRPMVSSQSAVTAVSCSKKHAELLRVKVGFPLLLMKEIQFDAQGLRVLYSVIYHNSSLMEFTVVRPGSRP
jgi:GntR family transcriptional regulator